MFRASHTGFTIIELMIAIAVLIVIVALALPSFEGVRQRAAVRGAGEGLLSFWNQSKLEAAKRNQMVKVGVVQSSSGAVFCLGAATTTDPADGTPCDCTDATSCDVARYPGANSEWSGSTLSGVTLGASNWPTVTAMAPAVIEPKRTALTTTGDAGTITLTGPTGNRTYQIRLSVDPLGRAVLCEPTSAPAKLSDYNGRRCLP